MENIGIRQQYLSILKVKNANSQSIYGIQLNHIFISQRGNRNKSSLLTTSITITAGCHKREPHIVHNSTPNHSNFLLPLPLLE